MTPPGTPADGSQTVSLLFFEPGDPSVSTRAQSMRRTVTLEDGAIWLGYTYAAGALHFSAMERVTVAGLQVESLEPLRLILDAQLFEPG